MNNVVSLVSYLVLTLFFCSGFGDNDIPELRFFKSKTLINNILTVTESKPFQIVFEDFYVKSLTCQIIDSNPVFSPGHQVIENHNNGTSILKVPGLISISTTKWDCAVSCADNTLSNVQFYIKIEAADKVKVVIDGAPQTFAKPLGYRGITVHLCEEGEIVDLTCSKVDNEGSLTFEYYDANGTDMIDFNDVESEDPINFRLIMTVESNGSYVDCTYMNLKSFERHVFTYRIIFIMKHNISRHNHFVITVNDMKLTAHDKDDIYAHKFIYGDQLTVTCEKTDKTVLSDIYTKVKLNSKMQKHYDEMGHRINITDIEKTESKYRFFIDTKYLDKVNVMCVTTTREKRRIAASIYFHKDPYEGPAILGLSSNNVLYQYDTRNKDRAIYYQYRVGQILNLTCIIQGISALQWYVDETLITSSIHVNPHYETSYINYFFKMEADTEYDIITCESMKPAGTTQRMFIALYRMLDVNDSNVEVPQVHDLNVEDNKTNHRDNNDAHFAGTNEIIGAIAGLILVTVVIVFCWWKSKRSKVNRRKETGRSINVGSNRSVPEQRESQEYAAIEYLDEHDCAIIRVSSENSSTDQQNGCLARPPAPPPRLPIRALSPTRAANVRISHEEKNPRPCRRLNEQNNLIPEVTNQMADQESTQIEYDYVYGRQKKSPIIPDLIASTPTRRPCCKPSSSSA